jgi:hypothetical protein
MNIVHGKVIRIEYSRESLGGISATEFEADLYDAIRDEWPGATVNIVESINDKYWGMLDAETEIPAQRIREISEDVFSVLCCAAPLDR